MTLRVFVEKRPSFNVEARALVHELQEIFSLKNLTGLRLINRYDVEGISDELFEQCIPTVFSEPQTDTTARTLPALLELNDAEIAALEESMNVFAVEALPGQFDQRADSASQCIQLLGQCERPEVRTAKIYVLEGSLSADEVAAVKRYVINPVEAREISLLSIETPKFDYSQVENVKVLSGFCTLETDALVAFISEYGLAMDLADIVLMQQYFRDLEQRDPTITEVKMIDTYWSDHCRHTTFNTVLENVEIDDALVQAAYNRYLKMRRELGCNEKPVCLMDIGTIGARYLKEKGVLKNLDISEEINACTVKIKADVNDEQQDWLLLFKNETHNHPTEIEPFGGAATCVGGAIRDPLSGRAYVYQAMRVTGAGDPFVSVADTIAGKLPQRKLVTTAAAGYSSYGNQIGIATGQVCELYHPGYVAKRMEIGAVVGATPASHVRRKTPMEGDVVVLLGGRTGRDGIGGATGSSKAHKRESLETCGAEVQKGNPLVERKIQRLFRHTEACQMIKRCNDFGAGGVAVAIGELADGLLIDLNCIPKKYEGLDGTELAISESQERMAVVLASEDVVRFLELSRQENLEATPVAKVTSNRRVRMVWNGRTIVDISRDFLASNGAPKHQNVHIVNVVHTCNSDNSENTVNTEQTALPKDNSWLDGLSYPFGKLNATESHACSYDVTLGYMTADSATSLFERMRKVLTNLNVASNKGLVERFDSTIGAGTVLMPFGGSRQLTPAMAMVAKLPVNSETTTVSAMSWGFNPFIMEHDQFRGAYLSVVESVAKLVASGFSRANAYLTFQEYFEKLHSNPIRWGKPMAALLGALMAQINLQVAAIGGKDSMSGSFENLDVPPTLVSFAIAIGSINHVVSPEFKGVGHRVVCVHPFYECEGGLLPEKVGLIETLNIVEQLINDGNVLSAATPGFGGYAEMLFKMCVGNSIGLEVDASMNTETWFIPAYGSFALELADDAELPNCTDNVQVKLIGTTTADYCLTVGSEIIDLAELQEQWESRIESIFPYRQQGEQVETISCTYSEANRANRCGRANDAKLGINSAPLIARAKPKVIIPVFPGSNCEFDSARAFRKAGAIVQVLVINNLSPAAVSESVEELVKAMSESNIVFIPGGFSGGDEPDGAAKFITSFFRAPAVTEAVRELLQKRDGLMLGICNGFQALVKLGLVPFGDIRSMDNTCPTLTFNTIGRHQSCLVRTRVASNKSPWFANCNVGDIHTIAISHGEGRFVANEKVLVQMKNTAQIATQYVDTNSMPSMDWAVNPNGSVLAIEGITSPDGRILGKMGHSERSGVGLYQNVPGANYQPIFEAGVKYFS